MSSPNVPLSVLKHIFRWKHSKIKYNTTKQTESECISISYIYKTIDGRLKKTSHQIQCLVCLSSATVVIIFHIMFCSPWNANCQLKTAKCIQIDIIVAFQSPNLNRTNTFDSIQLIRKFLCNKRIWKMFDIRRSNDVLNEPEY